MSALRTCRDGAHLNDLLPRHHRPREPRSTEDPSLLCPIRAFPYSRGQRDLTAVSAFNDLDMSTPDYRKAVAYSQYDSLI